MPEPSPVSAQILPDLSGKAFAEAEALLYAFNFVPIAPKGTYRRWRHEDGSTIFIAPQGRVVREGPRIYLASGAGYSHRFTPVGTKIKYVPGGPNTHNTGEAVIMP